MTFAVFLHTNQFTAHGTSSTKPLEFSMSADSGFSVPYTTYFPYWCGQGIAKAPPGPSQRPWLIARPSGCDAGLINILAHAPQSRQNNSRGAITASRGVNANPCPRDSADRTNYSSGRRSSAPRRVTRRKRRHTVRQRKCHDTQGAARRSPYRASSRRPGVAAGQ